MKEIPRTTSVGPLKGLQLQGVSYDRERLTFRVVAHYQLNAFERICDPGVTYGDLYIAGVSSDADSAVEALLNEIARLTGGKS